MSSDGRLLLTGCLDRQARLWEISSPLEGDVRRVVLWTQVLTGMELDEHDVPRLLDAASWYERRGRLEELRGMP